MLISPEDFIFNDDLTTRLCDNNICIYLGIGLRLCGSALVGTFYFTDLFLLPMIFLFFLVCVIDSAYFIIVLNFADLDLSKVVIICNISHTDRFTLFQLIIHALCLKGREAILHEELNQFERVICGKDDVAFQKFLIGV